jgi:SAM-dependent methyltransferase
VSVGAHREFRVGQRRGRRRQTGSLCLRSQTLLRLIIRTSQNTRFGPHRTPQTYELAAPKDRLESGLREYQDGERFFRHFAGTLRHANLRGLRILDLGCGYGGRTIYYANVCAAEHVDGIEISPLMVERCRRLAMELDCTGVRFSVGFAEDLPFSSESFDAAISFDVLEHVRDPVRAVSEVARVLRPGGRIWFVFPTYLGARASHLDYLTLVPGLHRIFDPDVTVCVANEFLVSEPDRFGTAVQPPPAISSTGRVALPTLNGLTLREAREIFVRSGFNELHETITPIIEPASHVPLGGLASRLLSAWHRRFGLPELLIGNIAVSGRKQGVALGEPNQAQPRELEYSRPVGVKNDRNLSLSARVQTEPVSRRL